jgi:serine phosphatase RsbU (regulator of sigma subunit)
MTEKNYISQVLAFQSQQMLDFCDDILRHVGEGGVALIAYHRLRRKTDVHLIWRAECQHYSLAEAETERQQQLSDEQQDRVFSSICERVGFSPGDQESYRFDISESLSGMLYAFAREDLGKLRDHLAENLETILLKLRNAVLVEALNRNDLELDLLQETGELLATSMGLRQVLKAIVEALKKLITFDAVGIFILDPNREQIEEIFSFGYRSTTTKEMLGVKAGKGLVGWVIENGKPLIVPDVGKDPRYIESRRRTRSELVIPLFSGGEVIGAFNIESNHPRAFTASDLDIVWSFANQAAVSVVRAQLYDEAIEQHKLKDELHIAKRIQESFLPDEFPAIPGFDLDAVNISSTEVGGDYYDFVPIVENQIGIAIADVAGHGVPAALIMASYRASLLAEIRNNYAIRTIMKKVNNLICESVKRGEFVTAVYGVLDTRNRVFTFANAGHNPPLLLRKSGKVEPLREGGLTLGILPDRDYEERPIYIDSGDILILYTDGITEAANAKDELFGTERLIALVKEHRNLPARQMRQRIMEAVLSYRSVDSPHDDLTLMLVKAD